MYGCVVLCWCDVIKTRHKKSDLTEKSLSFSPFLCSMIIVMMMFKMIVSTHFTLLEITLFAFYMWIHSMLLKSTTKRQEKRRGVVIMLRSRCTTTRNIFSDFIQFVHTTYTKHVHMYVCIDYYTWHCIMFCYLSIRKSLILVSRSCSIFTWLRDSKRDFKCILKRCKNVVLMVISIILEYFFLL